METTTTAGQPEGPPGCCQGMSPPVIAIAGPQGLDASSASQWSSMTALVADGQAEHWSPRVLERHESPGDTVALVVCRQAEF